MREESPGAPYRGARAPAPAPWIGRRFFLPAYAAWPSLGRSMILVWAVVLAVSGVIESLFPGDVFVGVILLPSLALLLYVPLRPLSRLIPTVVTLDHDRVRARWLLLERTWRYRDVFTGVVIDRGREARVELSGHDGSRGTLVTAWRWWWLLPLPWSSRARAHELGELLRQAITAAEQRSEAATGSFIHASLPSAGARVDASTVPGRAPGARVASDAPAAPTDADTDELLVAAPHQAPSSPGRLP